MDAPGKNILFKFLLILMVLLVTASKIYAEEILVSAAMSLKDAFSEMARDFEKKYPQHKVLLNFASSGQLQKQIEQGALVDVFASASTKELNSLEEKGFIISATRRIFARNSLVIISYKKIAAIDNLALNEFENLAIGDPGIVPAGKYAKDALEYYKVYHKVKSKCIFAENVRQVLDYVLRKEVDAGVVFKTDALMVKDPSLSVMPIDDKSHEKIVYPMAVIKGTSKETIAKLFSDFVASESAYAVLKRHGFLIP